MCWFVSITVSIGTSNRRQFKVMENQNFNAFNNENNQREREAKSFKSLKKWFEISPMRVTFKARNLAQGRQ